MRFEKLRHLIMMATCGGLTLVMGGCGTLITDALLQVGLTTFVSQLLGIGGGSAT